MKKNWRRAPDHPAKTVKVALPCSHRMWALRWLHARAGAAFPATPPFRPVRR